MRLSKSWLRVLVLGLLSAGGLPLAALAQGIGTSDEELPVEAVNVAIRNPSADEEVNKRVRDQVRTALSVFPLERFSRAAFDVAMARVRRTPGIAEADYALSGGSRGGVVVDVAVDLATAAVVAKPGGVAVNGWADFPVLYEGLGRYSRFKLEYLWHDDGNRDAWYGPAGPDARWQSAGGPAGSAGPGLRATGAEGFVQAGRLRDHPGRRQPLPSMAGLSALRQWLGRGRAVHQRHAIGYTRARGCVCGRGGRSRPAPRGIASHTTPGGRAQALHARRGAAARQHFGQWQRAGGTAVESALGGRTRGCSMPHSATTTSRPRGSGVDPDELPLVDSRTVVDGFNAGGADPSRGSIWSPTATCRCRAPASDTSILLGVVEVQARGAARARPARALASRTRRDWAGSVCLARSWRGQTHSRFSMRAVGRHGAESGLGPVCRRPMAWQPVVSYRYASVLGRRSRHGRGYERWDPLLSGGNGEQWVQGTNHFKVVQDSNVVAHRLQARLRPMARARAGAAAVGVQGGFDAEPRGQPCPLLLAGQGPGHGAEPDGQVFTSPAPSSVHARRRRCRAMR